MPLNHKPFSHVAGDDDPHAVERAPWSPPSRPLFSVPTYRALLRAFGVRPVEFFSFYEALRAVAGGAPLPPEGLVDRFRTVTRLVARTLTTEPTRAALADTIARVRPLLARFDSGRGSRSTFMQAAEALSTLIPEVAADRGVFVTPVPSGAVGWPAFRKMSEREERMEDLRRNDPAAWQTLQQSRRVVKQLDRALEDEVAAGGMVPSRKRILGRPVVVGTDPVSGDEYVFDLDGEMMSPDEYVAKRKRYHEERRSLERVFPDISDLRAMDDEELDALTTGSVQYVAMTDDKAKVGGLTRVYPAKRTLNGDMVVVDGRYKGILLDDLINRAGRMVEGVAYDIDPKSGVPVPMETKDSSNLPKVRVNREPYVTVSTEKEPRLYLRIPSTRAYTVVRNAVSDLAAVAHSVRYVEGSRKSAFTFEPKDFAAVRDALGGMALSAAAAKLLKGYFADLARHELAVAEENLRLFDTDAIGGFKPGVRLYTKQKEAMAWLESRRHAGVVALDSGVGKTSSAIASMMKAERDGLLDPGQKFLYVCPPALRGNLPLEVERFVENSDAFLDRVDIMTFPQFRVAANKDPSFASRYAMVFFDEAQHLKNITSATAQAALQLRHPKKILLTASPMEKSPMEAFTLVAICNNLDLTTPAGRAQIRGFRRRFCEEVGGKIVGIKNDPVILHDFRVWLKQNLFFADKRDVEEVALPHLRVVPLVVEMDPDVEAAYRDASKGLEKVLRGMVAKYRDRDPHADDPAIEAARVALAAEFRKLHELGSMPNRVIPGARNPKLDQTVEIVEERVGSGRRTLVFTDSPDLASDAAQALSAKFPVHLVAECQSAEIRVWQAGGLVRTYGPKAYTSHKKQWPKGEWKSFVLSQVVSPRPEFLVAVLTSSYAHGQNLQAFDTVVHLDRDSWNNETMKQRTARAWRSGQDHGVDEYILDAVYADPQNDKDETLDQIIGHLQRLESDLFDQVIVESQAEALGKEWFGMRRMHSSLVELNRRVLELTSSPFARRVGIGVQDPMPTSTKV